MYFPNIGALLKDPVWYQFENYKYVTDEQRGDTYEFPYIVRDYTLQYLDIMFDRRRVLRFKVGIRDK